MIKEYLSSITKLIVYEEIKKDHCITCLKELLEDILTGCPETDISETYHTLATVLLRENEGAANKIGSLWQNYFLEKILISDNPFTRQAARGKDIPPVLQMATEEDLKQLEILYRIDWKLIETEVFGQGLSRSIFNYESHSDAKVSNNDAFPQDYHKEKYSLKKLMDQRQFWADLLPKLADFCKKWGSGDMARYWVFKYNGENIDGIKNPDPIHLNSLIGIDSQRKQVIDNTQQFIKGYTANNILLYGDRGTGKSSIVKSLIHEYGKEGLRLIEISYNGLIKLPYLLRKLADKPQKFLLFIDDLSFEEYETQYKELKAVLEGGVEVQPINVLIYATSNRRHLIKEKFGDRKTNFIDTDGEEVRMQDTVQEKRSLSDRFGMTVLFTSPAQKQYLEIVRAIVQERNVKIEQEKLDRLALQWELMQNSRSGRTARQFVDHLAGQLAMEK